MKNGQRKTALEQVATLSNAVSCAVFKLFKL